MKTLLSFLLILLLGSCSTKYICKQAAIRCPPIIYDSVTTRDSIVYRDYTCWYPLPKDTVRDTIFIKSQELLNVGPYHKENGMVSIDVGIRNSMLWYKAYLNDSSIFIQLDSARKEAYYWREHQQVIQLPGTEKIVIPQVYKFSLWWFIGSLIALVVFLVIKLK